MALSKYWQGHGVTSLRRNPNQEGPRRLQSLKSSIKLVFAPLMR